MQYRIVAIHATTIIHQMGEGKLLCGELPDIDPVVTRGKVLYNCPEFGGLFWFGEDVVIESLSTGTWKIIDHEKKEVRDLPPVPFKLTGGEGLSISGGVKAICVARLDMMQVS